MLLLVHCPRGGFQQCHLNAAWGRDNVARNVIYAEVAKCCTDDDVTMEVGEMERRPCISVLKRERAKQS